MASPTEALVGSPPDVQMEDEEVDPSAVGLEIGAQEVVVAAEEVVESANESRVRDTRQAGDDVYEFKDSPENAAAMLLNQDVMRVAATVVSSGLPLTAMEPEVEDEEGDHTQEDVEDEEMDDGNDDAEPDYTGETASGRKVPPLRIMLPKDEQEQVEGQVKSKESPGTAGKSTPRVAKKTAEKRGTNSRVTRSTTRHTKKEQKSPQETPKQKTKPNRRPATRETSAARNLLEVESASAVPSPAEPQDDVSRSSGANSAEPSLSLQPERLPDEVYELFSKNDINRRLSMKKMSDFKRQLKIARRPHYESQVGNIEKKRKLPQVVEALLKQLPATNRASSERLLESHISQVETMESRHRAERQRTMEFMERETVRQFSYSTHMAKIGITAVRIFGDDQYLNANKFIEKNDEVVRQVGLKPQEDIAAQLKSKLGSLAQSVFVRQRFEAETLYNIQKYEWERRVLDQLPSELKNCVQDSSLNETDLLRVTPLKIDVFKIVLL